jgi:hypothetical protein
MSLPSLFASGHVVDLVLGVIAAEFLALAWRDRRRPGGRRVDLALGFAPGVCLLLALRAALTGAGWVWVAVWLTVSFPFHIADLMRRRR